MAVTLQNESHSPTQLVPVGMLSSSGGMRELSAGGILLDLVEQATLAAGSEERTHEVVLQVVDGVYGTIELVIDCVLRAGLPEDHARRIIRPIALLKSSIQRRKTRLWLHREKDDERARALLSEVFALVRQHADELREAAGEMLAEWEIRNHRWQLGRDAPTQLPPPASVILNTGGRIPQVTWADWEEAHGLFKEFHDWSAATREYNRRHKTKHSVSTISGWKRYLKRRERDKKQTT